MDEGKIKIVLVTGSLHGGGAERFAVNLANGIDSGKFDKTIVSWKPKKSYYLDESVKLENLFSKTEAELFGLLRQAFRKLPKGKESQTGGDSKKNIKAAFQKIFFKISSNRLKRFLRKRKPDIVFSCIHNCNQLVVESCDPECAVLLSERSFPHSASLGERNSFYPKAYFVIANSFQTRDFLRKAFPDFGKKIIAIHNPVDTESILFLGRENVEHKWLSGKKSPVIIACGRLDHGKGFDVLLKALKKARKKSGARLLILGEGPLKKELENLRDKLELKNHVDFIGWQNNPFKYMAKADAFIQTSRFEGFPNTIIEAMALGKPTISTNCKSGPKEIIKNKKNGILVPVDDETATAKAIINVLKDKKLKKKLEKNATKRAKEFDSKKIVKQFEKIFISAKEGKNSEGVA